MWRLLLGSLLLVCLVALGVAGRNALLNEGWRPLHATAFPVDDCAIYHVMRGMEQDPTRDPALEELVRKCGPGFVPWSLSQTGDPLRFDRPARIRLRFDPIDMQRFSNYPPLVVDFVYPRVKLPAEARLRLWGSLLQAEPKAVESLRRQWDAPWADLFALWSLGRGNHEVWLGGAAIGDPAFCEEIEHDRERDEDFCRLTLIDAATQQPLPIKLPLSRRMEIRLEVLDICRFGGVIREWDNPLMRTLAGTVEVSDRGCTPF